MLKVKGLSEKVYIRQIEYKEMIRITRKTCACLLSLHNLSKSRKRKRSVRGDRLGTKTVRRSLRKTKTPSTQILEADILCGRPPWLILEATPVTRFFFSMFVASHAENMDTPLRNRPPNDLTLTANQMKLRKNGVNQQGKLERRPEHADHEY